jgi:dUTP pyrophosphatase
MVTIQIKKLTSLAKTPTRGSDFAAGYDLYSTEDYTLKPLERKLFKTHVSIAIPSGHYGRIAPRSGLAFKDGLDTMAGVIDEDYRGDVGVILINLGNVDKEIKAGEKIAQLIIENYNTVTFEEVQDLPASVRDGGGFGSTDAKKPLPQVSTVDGALKAFSTIVESIPGGTLTELYQKGGGIPVKKRYSEEMKERQQ